MKSTEPISHTADKGIRIKADSLEELFAGALEGMAAIQMQKLPKSGRTHKESITVNAPDTTALLIDFLSEVHTLSDIHKVVFTELEIEKMTSDLLEARVIGYKVQQFDEDIKAVTHSQAEIRQNDAKIYETVVVFDM